jgi:hypothetical protein
MSLKVSEFVQPLSSSVWIFADEYDKFKRFADEVTGLKELREAKENMKEEERKEECEEAMIIVI